MMSLVILTVVLFIAITLLSFISKRIEKKVVFPISAVFISIIVFVVSFFVGKWEGMGLGAVSASLFIASIISLIVVVLLYNFSSNNSKNHHQD